MLITCGLLDDAGELVWFLGSVLRLKKYTGLAQEDREAKEGDLDLTWPSKGNIDFRNVSLQRGSEVLLDDISFSVPPGSKVALAGCEGPVK